MIVFYPVLLSLGVWQLQRADQKEKLLEEFSENKKLPPVEWSLSGNKQGRLVTLEGHFKAQEYWLLDNKIVAGKVGYEVLMPFYADNKVAIVNRGWIEGDRSRQSLPKVEIPVGRVNIIGRSHVLSKNPLLSYETTAGWPKIIAATDLQLMYQELSQSSADNIIRLQPDSTAALYAQWPTVNVKPQKHIAYAVQWFAMAAALIIMFAFYTFREDKVSQ